VLRDGFREVSRGFAAVNRALEADRIDGLRSTGCEVFGLLGLFEVADRGSRVELPRGKERALLAVLLLHANEPVSKDGLVDELWPERPPANAPRRPCRSTSPGCARRSAQSG
jgi:hypothetical protein